jgi:hypothetical protein
MAVSAEVMAVLSNPLLVGTMAAAAAVEIWPQAVSVAAAAGALAAVVPAITAAVAVVAVDWLQHLPALQPCSLATFIPVASAELLRQM